VIRRRVDEAGIEFRDEFPTVFELHRQGFIRQLKVRTDFFEEIAILLGDQKR
jgi:hypothetical protein